MKTRVYKDHLKKLSSRQWVERQLNDPFVIAAKRQGYRSRSAFKLIEIDDKFRLIKKSSRVLDLGAAPGGWSQVIVDRSLSNPKRKIVAVDLLDMQSIAGVSFIMGDFTSDEVLNEITSKIDGKPDLILSDMAPNTIGHAKTDHIRAMVLVESAADFAFNNLEKGGSFVAKIFQGGSEKSLLITLRNSFEKVSHFKPKSSRKESPELYMVAVGFKGGSND